MMLAEFKRFARDCNAGRKGIIGDETGEGKGY
jgi:hypothetical protein